MVRFAMMALTTTLLSLNAPCAHAERYKVADLDKENQYYIEYTKGIGPQGDVALRLYSDARNYFGGVSRKGHIEIPAESTTIQAINASGDVLGYGHHGPTIWLRQGGELDITYPGGAPNATAAGFNDARMVVGTYREDKIDRCYGWTPENGHFKIRVAHELRNCHATAVNNIGQVAGYREDDQGNVAAFIWQDGQMNMLPLLPGRTICKGMAINEKGDIVGRCEGTPWHPVLWRNGSIIDLYSGADLNYGHATGINDSGTIVGVLNGDAVIFSETGEVTRLADHIRGNPPSCLSQTHDYAAINDSGQIAVGVCKLVPVK